MYFGEPSFCKRRSNGFPYKAEFFQPLGFFPRSIGGPTQHTVQSAQRTWTGRCEFPPVTCLSQHSNMLQVPNHLCGVETSHVFHGGEEMANRRRNQISARAEAKNRRRR